MDFGGFGILYMSYSRETYKYLHNVKWNKISTLKSDDNSKYKRFSRLIVIETPKAEVFYTYYLLGNLVKVNIEFNTYIKELNKIGWILEDSEYYI